MSKDMLGARMKEYEAVTRDTLLPHSYTILRVDGRSFHTYLRDAVKPFDAEFISNMQDVAHDLCSEVQGAVFAYGQSDEISILIADTGANAEPWFGGVVQKMASVAAGVATASLISHRGASRAPHFDARVFTLPSKDEVANYFVWRIKDAKRNAITMAAQTYFSAKKLEFVPSGQRLDMMRERHGVAWEDFPFEFRNGWFMVRVAREMSMTYTHKGTGEEVTTTAMRSFYETVDPDVMSAWDMVDRYLRTEEHDGRLAQ